MLTCAGDTFWEDEQVRRGLPLTLSLLVVLGCRTEPPPIDARTEVVTVKIPFRETFEETEGAKRVVVCQFKDERDQAAYIGEGSRSEGGVVRKFVVREDLTQVMPRILGGYLKRTGFSVSFDERLQEVVGSEPVRDIIKRHEADYLIAGRLEEFYVRSRGDAGHPVFVSIAVRLDIYNQLGELRMYFPQRVSEAEFLGEKSTDSAEVSALVYTSVHALHERAFEDTYFLKALDLDPAAVREMMKARPVPEEAAPEEPEEAEPEEAPAPETTPAPQPAPEPTVEPEPEAPKPRELTEEEKAEQRRLQMIRELDEAVKTPPAPE